jgi:rhamnose utilization protein RhaD (predicted bifunctional aldolase and dehydrogenase)
VTLVAFVIDNPGKCVTSFMPGLLARTLSLETHLHAFIDQHFLVRAHRFCLSLAKRF